MGLEEVVLRDHRVKGVKVLPGVASVEMLLAAGRLAFEGGVRLRQVVWQRPVMGGGEGLKIRVELERDEQGRVVGVEPISGGVH